MELQLFQLPLNFSFEQRDMLQANLCVSFFRFFLFVSPCFLPNHPHTCPTGGDERKQSKKISDSFFDDTPLDDRLTGSSFPAATVRNENTNNSHQGNVVMSSSKKLYVTRTMIWELQNNT